MASPHSWAESSCACSLSTARISSAVSVLIPLGSRTSCSVRPKMRPPPAWGVGAHGWLGTGGAGPTLAADVLRLVFAEPGGEVVEGEGLEQVARDPELHGPLDGIGLVGRTDDDHIAIGTLDSDLADQIEAEDVRQVQVEQDEVRTQRARRVQRIGPGVCDADGAESFDPVHER